MTGPGWREGGMLLRGTRRGALVEKARPTSSSSTTVVISFLRDRRESCCLADPACGGIMRLDSMPRILFSFYALRYRDDPYDRDA